MNDIRNINEVRFRNIYILSNIIYYILALTIIIALPINAVAFPLLSVTFLQCVMVTSNIKHEFFHLGFLLFRPKIYYFIGEQTKKTLN